MFEYKSFRSRPEDLDDKMNAFAIDGWELDTLHTALEKQGIWFVVMKRAVKAKDPIKETIKVNI